MAKLNAEWHRKNPMPPKATLDERVAWHTEHAKHCACREIPDKIRAEVERRTDSSKS